MKKPIVILVCAYIFLSLFSCSPQLCLERRTDRLIEKTIKKVDTIYLYSIAFSDFNFIWYNKDGFIHGAWIHPYATKNIKPVKAENIDITKDGINKYFGNHTLKDIPCFTTNINGAWIKIYIKDTPPLSSGVELGCIFRGKYPESSFPYKLQYDFAKLKLWEGVDVDFQKLYPDVERKY